MTSIPPNPQGVKSSHKIFLNGKRKLDADSPYLKPCPTCNAEPLHHCVSRSGERVNIHRARKMQIPVEPLPDLSAWWRSMKPYEGKYAKLRPARLVVP